MSEGMSNVCSRVPKNLLRPTKLLKTAALLTDVHTPTTIKRSKEYVKLHWDNADLRPGKYRGQKSPKDVTLGALNYISDGNAVMLHYV